VEKRHVPLRWLKALEGRYRGNLTTAEFLKAVRALSARYVERRRTIVGASTLDSAGKRAAFASFYAPLHFFTVREIVRALDGPARSADRLIDFGCGTGAASAAWALECTSRPSILGVDARGWMRDEAAWTWRSLGLRGRVHVGDMVEHARRACHANPRGRPGWLFAWSVNELDTSARERLLDALANHRPRSSSLLVIEPLARAVTPWWDEWARALGSPDLRCDEWHLAVDLPPELASIDEAAGFDRAYLGARSLWRPALADR